MSDARGDKARTPLVIPTTVEGSKFTRYIMSDSWEPTPVFNTSLAVPGIDWGTRNALSYTSFIEQACKEWGITRDKSDLVLFYTSSWMDGPRGWHVETTSIVDNDKSWNWLWRRWSELKDRVIPRFTIAVKPQLPVVLLAREATDSARNDDQEVPPNTTALAAPTAPTAPATVSSDTVPAASTSGTASMPATAAAAASATTPLSNVADGQTRNLLAENIGSILRNVVGDVSSMIFETAQESLSDVIFDQPHGHGRMPSSGTEAGQMILNAIDRVVLRRQSAQQQQQEAAPAPATVATQREEPCTASSSYDNAPPSEPLRETPVPDDVVGKNGAASDKGKEREHDIGRVAQTSQPAATARTSQSTTRTASPSTSDDWQFPTAAAAKEETPATTTNTGSQDDNSNANAIEANNVALEDAFNAMLSRLRQQPQQ